MSRRDQETQRTHKPVIQLLFYTYTHVRLITRVHGWMCESLSGWQVAAHSILTSISGLPVFRTAAAEFPLAEQDGPDCFPLSRKKTLPSNPNTHKQAPLMITASHYW